MQVQTPTKNLNPLCIIVKRASKQQKPQIISEYYSLHELKKVDTPSPSQDLEEEFEHVQLHPLKDSPPIALLLSPPLRL